MTVFSFPLRVLVLPALLGALAGCASGPTQTLTLNTDTPTSAPAATEQVHGVRVTPVRWTQQAPACSGQCPRLEVESVAFPDYPALTRLVDAGLAYMTGLGESHAPVYRSISDYAHAYWRSAGAHDVTHLHAEVVNALPDVIVVALNTGQYVTGAAHGIPANQYLNWQRSTQRILSLEDLLEPGQRPAFEQALRAAHATWLQDNPDAINDRQAYLRMWPFQENDNVALGPQGLLVKYSAYAIAPYSHGEPVLTLPYTALEGILKPAFLPARR